MMAKKPVPSLTSVPVVAPADPEQPPTATLAKLPRESLHVRVPSELAERVREAAHRLRRDKQDIATEALHEWLSARGL
jgi:hypothetical protein